MSIQSFLRPFAAFIILTMPAWSQDVTGTVQGSVSDPSGGRIPGVKVDLLNEATGTAAIAELGYSGAQGEYMIVLENTPKVHNLVVCTLCSCYPWPTLGLPPAWYKSAPYRSRAVLDPRGVLKEFGLELPDDVEVRVWDSTAEIRYLVLPDRPAGTERMTEAELAALVTRDSMVGVAKVSAPSPGDRT